MDVIVALWHRLLGTNTASILSDIHSKINKLHDHRDRQLDHSTTLEIKASKLKTASLAATAEANAAHNVANRLKELIS